jgi:hypothetical protein
MRASMKCPAQCFDCPPSCETSQCHVYVHPFPSALSANLTSSLDVHPASAEERDVDERAGDDPFPVKLQMWDFGQCDAKRCVDSASFDQSSAVGDLHRPNINSAGCH